MSGYALWTAIWQGFLGGILCLGVYVSFSIVRFPDLTCDGSYPLGACIVAVTISAGFNPFLGTALAVICGAVAGTITGLLNTKLKIPAIVASILVMLSLYSVNLVAMNAPIISLSKTKTVFWGIENFISKNNNSLNKYHITNIIYPLLFLVVVYLIKKSLDWFLNTEFGIALRAAGDNPKMARAMGINEQAMVWIGLALANGLIAFSGALFAQIQKFADVNLGIGMIIVGLASVFIGEAINNRVFKTKKLVYATTCVILGSMIYKFAIAVAYEIGLSTDYFNLLTSTIVIVALLIPTLRSNILSVIRRS